MARRQDIDALRGLMLALMTLTHLPTRFAAYVGQPFGFVSSAEGFVFVSAFMAGWIYGQRAHAKGLAAMRRALWQRALKLYACQVALLLFLLFVVTPIARSTGQTAITNLASFFDQDPRTALLSGMALVYNPPLLDILPMYVLFVAATPVLLTVALRRGWWPIFGISAVLWMAAQFGAGQALYDAVAAAAHFGLPYRETGAFSFLAWQLMWNAGLWLGSIKANAHAPALAAPRWAVAPALVVATMFLIWRHAVGPVPFPLHSASELNELFDKWHLAPLRLLDFAALLVLVLHYGSRLAGAIHSAFFERLGAASLPVFCAHLVICLLALSIVGDQYQQQNWGADAVLLIGTFAALYAVAEFALRTSVRATADLGRRPAAELSSRTVRSPISTVRSPSR